MRLILGENSDHLLDCLMTDEELTDAQIIEINLLTAIHRHSLSGYDLWRGVEVLARAHPEWKQKEIAQHLSVDASRITQLLSPGKLNAAWQEALQAGRATIADCYAASKADSSQWE
jgi:hypothetical protein